MRKDEIELIPPRARKKLQSALERIEKAGDALLTLVQNEMDKAARRHGLTKIECLFTTNFYKGDEEVEVPELSAIERAYCEYAPSGFMGIWTPERGWDV
jgi:hypothetical protein